MASLLCQPGQVLPAILDFVLSHLVRDQPLHFFQMLVRRWLVVGLALDSGQSDRLAIRNLVAAFAPVNKWASEAVRFTLSELKCQLCRDFLSCSPFALQNKILTLRASLPILYWIVKRRRGIFTQNTSVDWGLYGTNTTLPPIDPVIRSLTLIHPPRPKGKKQESCLPSSRNWLAVQGDAPFHLATLTVSWIFVDNCEPWLHSATTQNLKLTENQRTR